MVLTGVPRLKTFDQNMDSVIPNEETLLQIQVPNPQNLEWDLVFNQEIKRLSQGNNLQRRLEEITARLGQFDRVFVLGCGRSGTWLLMQLLSTLKDQDIVPKELPVEAFGLFATRTSRLLIKRHYLSYRSISRIPRDIRIIYIVRHPYDVLTSHNPITKRDYHIQPERWVEEMKALSLLMTSEREQHKIVRYEDLVSNPIRIQAELAAFLGAEIAMSPEEIAPSLRLDASTRIAMHGVRKIDTNSLGKYRGDPRKLEYLRSIRGELGETLSWVSSRFDYDIGI
jgi:hypothetical protein